MPQIGSPVLRFSGSRLGLIVALLLLTLLPSSNAAAQASDRHQAFVYGINAASGTSFLGDFAPPSVGTIYLLADQTSILSPRMTEIYFWAITNEYQASWDTLNQPVPGTLEILSGGQVIQQTQPTSYTIQYKPRGSDADATLLLGDAAQKAQTAFLAKQAAYRDASSKYLEDHAAWIEAADAANAKRQAGENVTVPPEPQQPDPIDTFSNGLNAGIPVKLAAGNYKIQLRQPDGSVLAGSERNLVMFAPRRTAIGYTVLPETRWTTPEQVNDLNDVILGRADSQIYLVPHITREYPADAYALLQKPQQQVAANAEWTWVMGEPITAGELEIAADGRAAERQQLTPYSVKQVAGSDLGYQVQPFVATPNQPHAPDFIGYALHLSQPNAAYTIHMLSPQGGALAESQRLVRTPATLGFVPLLLLSAVPLVVGAAIITRRWRRMRLPRDVVK